MDVPDECWRWPVGKPNDEGRPRLRWGMVYRITYRMLVDPDLPDDLDLHHLCGHAWCVNPWHLQPLPRKEHIALHRSMRPRKTVCVNGHDLTDPANVAVTIGRTGRMAGRERRNCRACMAEWKRRHRAAAKG